ncbi:hypothetical protein DY000_02019957 [Brassica cretica]|uniref:Reverse transcriptase zinc-binding domain-containing protein n=1 Tax=Brassica cretica TaxID=69181 RepID=A0ABQ7D8T3_BRACR|nr:hypothetical protein DY000_02019957 [Brassica cretica]
MGRLLDITGDVGTYYLGVARTARVSEAVLRQRWNIRGNRSRHFHALHDRIQNERVPLDEHGRYVVLWKHAEITYESHFSLNKTWDQIRVKKDKVVWSKSHGRYVVLWKHAEITYESHFSLNKTWDQIRVKKDKVVWSKSVWFPQGVPRYSFIVWLAIKDRLSTGVHMRAWGIQQICLMCGERNESRDHIFFACPFTFTVWNRLAGRLCGRRINPDWSLTLQFVTRNALSSMDKILVQMVFQTCIYYMWKEMNDRRH